VDHLDPSSVPSDVRDLCARLREKGKKAYVVGGCVRDLIRGATAADWDVTTDAQPEELMKIFPKAIPTGIAHGTVTVVKNKQHFEVTTFRGEAAYSDGRRPDAVHFVNDITEDLARRDFTVNAIALDPIDGHVIDPFGGREDLQRKMIRAVGIAQERFDEDGLRVLRAARFVAQLEFELDIHTKRAIPQSLETFKKVSMERVRDEWTKTMKARAPSRAFEVMREGGILGVVCPELLLGVGMEQNKYHAFDVWGHAMACVDACTGDPILRVAALFHDVGKPATRAFSDKTKDYTFYEHERVGAEIVEPICTRLRFSNDERARITDLVRYHLFHYSDEWTDAAVRRWIRRVGKDRVDDLYVLNEADVRGKGRDCSEDLAALAGLKAHVAKVLAAGAALSTRDLKLNGRDLMQDLGMKPGRQLGEILDALLEAVVAEPSLNDREKLLDLARRALDEKPDAKKEGTS
jgi:tRNA nucleotidyltransferase (CCA-adding enzyme)